MDHLDHFLTRNKVLIGYYGMLQCMHLLFLARAVVVYFSDGRMPFPASPPLAGWSDQVFPFFIGMGLVDAIAASLGIYFAYCVIFVKTRSLLSGLISLTAAFSSALIFLVGTLPSGAWNQNLYEYLILVMIFCPAILLYIRVLQYLLKANL